MHYLLTKNWEDATMKTRKMYNEDDYELDNQYNEEERYYYSQNSSSSWDN